MNKSLFDRLTDLAEATHALPDDALDVPWAWQSYDSEGLRFAFLRLTEELEMLAAVRTASAVPLQARSLMANYNRAYWDLQAVVAGLTDKEALVQPGEEDWNVRRTYAHIFGADLGFFAVVTFALEQHHAGDWSAEKKLADPDWDRLLDLTEAEYVALMESDLSGLRKTHAGWHARILADFSGLPDAEMDLPSAYWEAETYPLRFRLGRFASHMRQHTVQIEKTLAALGRSPAEASCLVRQAFGAYAAVESAGGPPADEEAAGVLKLLAAIREML